MNQINYSVIGLGFGDEGKGLTVDYLANGESNAAVIRHSGGHQVGHGVMHNGEVHEFRHFGSGTFRGVPTYWMPACTVSPISFQIEHMTLFEKFGIKPELNVMSNCPVTTMYDVAYNRAINSINKHGSVGVGFAATLKRHQLVPLFANDLKYKFITKQKLDSIFKYYLELIEEPNLQRAFGYFLGDLKFTPEIFLQSCEYFVENTNINTVKFDMTNFSTFIFEGNQGMLLDKDHGIFPNVTYGNTSNKAILRLPDEVYYVTRCYSTRHGHGPLQNEDKPLPVLKNNQWETNHLNPHQGEFRHSLLSYDHIKYAIDCDSMYLDDCTSKTLVITCMDQIDNPMMTVGKDIVPLNLELFEDLVDHLIVNTSPSSDTFKQLW